MKKFLFSFLALSLALSSAIVALPTSADNQVCGVDNVNYESEEAAETAGVDVSYEFACVNVTDESKLYEAKSDIRFAGMLIEIGSTDIPTTIIVRDNAEARDYTINVTEETILGQRRDQVTKLSDWIPGDQIKVTGKKNENTETINATILYNVSILIKENQGANGWITNINKDANEITYQWNNRENTFKYDENTKFVSGLKNPASVDDLEINDRIRARLLFRGGSTPTAKIVVVLRRGKDLFMKIRTFRPNATLVRLDSTIAPTTIQVRMDQTPGLRANDVNNLIGTEGALITVNITENTKIVRKYFGKTTLDEFSVGDKLKIVGRVNNDGTVDAKMVKNNSIWKTSTQGHAGVVTEVNAENSYVMVNWTPLKHVTIKVLKEKLEEAEDTVTAQMLDDDSIEIITEPINNEIKIGAVTMSEPQLIKEVSTGITVEPIKIHSLREELKIRIKKVVVQTIGKFNREVKYKKVEINRIKTNGVKIGDLVQRLPIKKIRVDITPDTSIVVGTNNNATISDIQNGDKVRIRGTKYANLPLVVADTIVVVNSLPEIEEAETVEIDDINEIVSVIVTDDPENAIVDDSNSDTEEEIDDDGLENVDDDSDDILTNLPDSDAADNTDDNSQDTDDLLTNLPDNS